MEAEGYEPSFSSEEEFFIKLHPQLEESILQMFIVSNLTDSDDSSRIESMDFVAKTLSAFGLTDKEAKVYRVALNYEETSPFALSRETKIPRTSVYEILLNLSLKGLVELVRSDGFSKQQTRIKAKNPSILREILASKRENLTKLDVDLVQILPDLKKEYLRHVPNADFRFYMGVEGAAEVYKRMNSSDSKEPIVAWDCLMPMDSFGLEQLNKWIDTENQRKQNTNIRAIIPLSGWTKHVMSYQYERDSKYLSRDFRYVEDPSFDLYQDIQIQGNIISIVNGVKEEAWGIIMNSELLAKSLTSIFEIVWKIAKPVTPELVKSWGPNEFRKQELKKA